MEILVTGAAGRIGSHVVEELRAEHHVIATSRHPERYTGMPNVTSHELDITDSEQLQNAFSGKRIEAIVHLASLSFAESENDQETARRINTEATRELGKLSIRHGVRYFINCSSSSIYNQELLEPTPEDKNIGPLSVYGRTKLAAEEALATIAETDSDTSFTSLRLFNVYGDGLDRSLVQKMMSDEHINLFWNNFSRDYIHVGDVVRAISLVLQSSGQNPGQHIAMNIGSGISLNNQELLEAVEAHGWTPDYSIVDNEGTANPYTWADIGLAGRLIGFDPVQRLQIPSDFSALSPAELW